MRDENKQTHILTEPVLFDHQLIRRITFDLVHINQGWDNVNHHYAYKNRSTYKAEDIIEFFEQFKYIQVVWILGTNKFKQIVRGVTYYRYHWQTTDTSGEVIRIYLDIPQKYSGEGVIVTIFKP